MGTKHGGRVSVTSRNSPAAEAAGRQVGRDHLDTAQSQASSHSSLHILVLKLVQEAQKSLGEVRGQNQTWEPSALTLSTREPCQTHPFPEDRTEREAPELGADSGHDFVVAVDQQGAKSPKPIPSQAPFRC